MVQRGNYSPKTLENVRDFSAQIHERTLEQLAADAGLHPVACPHCGKKVSALQLFDDLFWAIAEAIKAGGFVSVHNWGSFIPSSYKASGSLEKKNRFFHSMRISLARRAREFFKGEWHPDEKRSRHRSYP